MKSSKTLAIAALAVAGTIGAAAPASAHSAAAPITKAKATSIANAINFKASDFTSAYKETAYQPTASDKATQKKFQACIGGKPALVDVTGAEFDNSNGYGFSSEVAFVPSVAALKADAKRNSTSHALQCIRQQLNAAAKEAGASNPKITLARLSEGPVSGLDATFGFKFSIAFTVAGQTAHIYGYDYGFGRGNAEVSMTEIGTTAVPESTNVKPLEKLIARAEQQVPANGIKIS
jgi:hypothetical protein